LLPRLLSGRKTGPVFLTDRKARPSVAKSDGRSIDPARQIGPAAAAAELFEAPHRPLRRLAPCTLHQLRHFVPA